MRERDIEALGESYHGVMPIEETVRRCELDDSTTDPHGTTVFSDCCPCPLIRTAKEISDEPL